MAVQFSVAVRNARLDSIESIVSTDPVLEIRTGAQPANCAAARTGTILASIQMPSDWLAAAASGIKSKSGTWQDLSADASGTAGHWVVYANDGTTCHMQGEIVMAPSDGSMVLDNTNFAAGQAFTVVSWSVQDGNA